MLILKFTKTPAGGIRIESNEGDVVVTTGDMLDIEQLKMNAHGSLDDYDMSDGIAGIDLCGTCRQRLASMIGGALTANALGLVGAADVPATESPVVNVTHH